MSADDVLAHVEAHLRAQLGEPSGRASVTFLGTEQLDVLRFAGVDVARYVTLGMSRRPMTDPGELHPTVGPRAELVLSLNEPRDEVYRALAVLAASPVVEGVVVSAGATLTLGQPLWPDSPYDAVLVGEPAGLLASTVGVDFFPLLPMTPAEAAWKRVHGAAALQERWLAYGTDLRDPRRAAVPLA